ncbi:hypothetical protein [Sulfitobacter dubius]|uniref:hypothetical protein n=1 Tax=Sulfitobacter dubius TaxID=218673 RepID=UPI001FABDA7F|nr:hypothetical protein [Sulfitobacter dubius]
MAEFLLPPSCKAAFARAKNVWKPPFLEKYWIKSRWVVAKFAPKLFLKTMRGESDASLFTSRTEFL